MFSTTQVFPKLSKIMNKRQKFNFNKITTLYRSLIHSDFAFIKNRKTLLWFSTILLKKIGLGEKCEFEETKIDKPTWWQPLEVSVNSWGSLLRGETTQVSRTHGKGAFIIRPEMWRNYGILHWNVASHLHWVWFLY